MIEEKPKKILFILGIMEGHVTSTIELVKDLVSLWYNLFCYVLDEFAERYKNTGAKLKIFSFDKKDLKELNKDRFSFLDIIQIRSLYAILDQGQKDQEKYDYLLVDSLFDGKEMNKIFMGPLLSQYIHFNIFIIQQTI